MINNFLNYYKKSSQRYFEENKKAKIVTAFLMILAIFIIAIGVYFFTKYGFESTQKGVDDFVSKAIPLYIYHLFFLIIGILVFISALIFGLFSFFNSENDDWVLSSPKLIKLPNLKFIIANIESLWPIAIIAFPLILAIKNVFNFSNYSFGLIFISVLFFAIGVVGMAINLIFILSLALKKLKIFNFKILIFLLVLIIIGIGFISWQRTVLIDLDAIFQVQEIAPELSFLTNNFKIFPSNFIAMLTYDLTINNYENSFYFWYNTLFFIGVVMIFILFKSQYIYVWQLFQEKRFEAKNNLKINKPFLRKYPKSAEDAFLKKELLINFRSAENIFWILFLSILMIIQVGVVNLLEKYIGIGDSSQMFEVGITPSLQLGVILFFSSAFMLRFVFPSFSQEANTSWIIGTAPIKMKKIFDSKYKFFSLLIFLISFLSLLIYLIPLKATYLIISVSFFILTVAILTLSMIALSVGAIFINLKTNNPQKLSTSAPGIIFTLFSLFYSTFAAFSAYSILNYNNYILILFLIIFSLLISIFIRKKAINSLNCIEFI